MSKFNEMLKQLKISNETGPIKMEQNKPYNAQIKMITENLNQQNKSVIQIIMILTDLEMQNKKIQKTFYTDESYSDIVRNIAYRELLELLSIFEINIPDDIDESGFLTLLQGLKNKNVIVSLKKITNKKDPKKHFNNYTIYKDIDSYNIKNNLVLEND